MKRAAAAVVVIASLAAFGGTPIASKPVPSAPTSLSWALPKTAVGRQLAWLTTAAPRAPLAQEEIEQHFDRAFLATFTPAQINQGLVEVPSTTPWRIVSLDAGTTAAQGLAVGAYAGTTLVGVEIATDAHGLISLLGLARPASVPVGPASWAALDRAVRTLAPDVGFEAATLGSGGHCDPINAVQPATPRPLASMFKLYVLGAVADAVADGHLSWSRSVELTARLRSRPSGSLQIEPVGTRYTVQDLAELMISSSDNTAADELAALVGRPAVEREALLTMVGGVASASARLDVPFLRTREVFALKYAHYPDNADTYLGKSARGRLAFLQSVIDKIPLSAVHPTGASVAAPRLIDSVEWFAAPADVCSQYAHLYLDAGRTALTPVSGALSINDGGLGLASRNHPLVWFKGGSETGVLTLGYLARSASGRVVIVVLTLSDPEHALNGGVTDRALGIVNAAFRLSG